MSKKVLWILTIALSAAMAGLVIVQITWVNNALELNSKQFQQLVNTTLMEVSDQLDHYYASSKMKKVIREKDADHQEIEWTVEIDKEETPAIKFNQKKSDNMQIAGQQDEGTGDRMVEMLADTLVVIIDTNSGTAETLHIRQYHELESRKKLEESIREKEILVTTVMQAMLLENVPFEERVEQQLLEKMLHKNFMDRGINLGYEYAVVRNNSNLIYESENFSKDTDHYYFRSGLMGDQFPDKNDTYLYLYFPGQKALVRGSLGFLGISTLFLTFLMIILFSFALYVIFRQKKLSEIKNDFVNNMTHELKTPISTISLASQMLSDQSIPAERKNTGHISTIIQTESKRLGYQVERVLQMAVLDQGHLVLKKEHIGLKEIVSNVVQNFKLQVESKSGSLELIDNSLSDGIVGDKVHITNVLTNLIDNAIKYCRDKPKIAIQLENEEDLWFVLKVKDNGVGISKENQKKVFDKFFRVSTGNLHDVKGFGLGLSYVKLIVEQHGGTIKLASELNRGTQFEIKLPLFKEN
ncbi:MAG: HAMP domain-containing histidine kinase [Bacteroidales bacterium]|nr:HAMP domain-containing histidine kinase [Bacteroidales bacterium]